MRTLRTPTAAPHFGLLAQALIHGHLHVDGPVYDGVVRAGKTYLPFGPLPAVLMIPSVAIAGPGFPVLWLGIVAVGVAAVGFWRLWSAVGVAGARERSWLTVATVAGTAMLSAAVLDSSYFVAHLVVIACLVWALTLALEGRWPLLCGVLVSLAALTRANAALAAIPLVAIYWQRGDGRRRLAGVLAPLAVGLAVLAAYNALRFGSLLDSGYGGQSLANPELLALRNQGLFSVRHLPVNLYYLLIAPPVALGGGVPFPWLEPSPWGMGLVFVSPWILLALWARGRLALILALGFGVVILPSLLYYGIGWIQFGYRYGLDGLPFLAALVALGARRRPGALLPVMASASVAINLAGAAWLVSTLGA